MVLIAEVVAGDVVGVGAATTSFDDYRAHYGYRSAPGASSGWLVEQLISSRLRLFLAAPDGEVDDACGFVTVTVIPASLIRGVWWQVRDLWVAPGARRRGIGRALLDHVIREARVAGALRVGLQTEVDNDPALALYESLGFTGVTGLRQLTLDTAAAGSVSEPSCSADPGPSLDRPA